MNMNDFERSRFAYYHKNGGGTVWNNSVVHLIKKDDLKSHRRTTLCGKREGRMELITRGDQTADFVSFSGTICGKCWAKAERLMGNIKATSKELNRRLPRRQ